MGSLAPCPVVVNIYSHVMSKVNAMQAIREARYAARIAKAPPTVTEEANRVLAGGHVGAGDELNRPIGLVPSASPSRSKPAPEVSPTSAEVNAIGDATGMLNVEGGADGGRPATAAGRVGGAPTNGGEPLEAAVDTDVDEADGETEALCGHRSMNNRNCRRPAGHAEKNHRYS